MGFYDFLKQRNILILFAKDFVLAKLATFLYFFFANVFFWQTITHVAKGTYLNNTDWCESLLTKPHFFLVLVGNQKSTHHQIQTRIEWNWNNEVGFILRKFFVDWLPFEIAFFVKRLICLPSKSNQLNKGMSKIQTIQRK